MPCVLLPASAAAFKPRVPPTAVLNKKPDLWLTQTLKRVKTDKRPLNNANQHQRCLVELLGGPDALWSLCSLAVPKSPRAQFIKDDEPHREVSLNYDWIHVESYCVSVDMVHANEVAFKLTDDTIARLIKYHNDVWIIDDAASLHDWTEKKTQIKTHNEDFRQAVNKFTWRTGVTALEGMEAGGSGELLEGKANEAKKAILGLFLPLMPPPQQIENLYNPAYPLPLPSMMIGAFYGQTYNNINCQVPQPQPLPVDFNKVLPSSPSTVSSNQSFDSMNWPYQVSLMNTSYQNYGLPSPTPSFSQPSLSTTAPCSATSSYAWTDELLSPEEPMDLFDPSWSMSWPMENVVAQSCGLQEPYMGFEWEKFQDCTMIM